MIAKLWPGLSLAIIAFLAFLLLRGGCKKDNSVDLSQKIEAAAKAAYDSARRIDTPIIVRLTKKSDSISRAFDTLKREHDLTIKDLLACKDDLHRTLVALDQAKTNRDTAARLLHADTLEAEVKSGIPVVEGYTHLTDSMINACEAQVAIKDSIIYRQDRIAKVAAGTISTQQMQYDFIIKDDLKKTAQLKFYRPAACISTAILAAIIVFKFISH